MSFRRCLLTLLALCGFLASELVSPFPRFHSHANELANLLAAPGGPAEWRGTSTLSRNSSSGECPACAIFGLSALMSFGPAAVASNASVRAALLFSVSLPIAVQHSIERGRAPPSS